MIEQPNTIRDRLSALAGAMLQSSKFNPAFIPVLKNLITKFMKDASEDDLQKGIIELRDKYIPWVLTGMMPRDPDADPSPALVADPDPAPDPTTEAAHHDTNTLKE